MISVFDGRSPRIRKGLKRRLAEEFFKDGDGVRPGTRRGNILARGHLWPMVE